MPYKGISGFSFDDYVKRKSEERAKYGLGDLNTAGLSGSAKQYAAGFGREASGMMGGALGGLSSVMDTGGTQSIFGGLADQYHSGVEMGAGALDAIAAKRAAERGANAQRSAADQQASSV